MGLGATTPAAGKLGGNSASSEVDLSDMFLSLGLLGGLAYALVIVLVLTYAFRDVAPDTPDCRAHDSGNPLPHSRPVAARV